MTRLNKDITTKGHARLEKKLSCNAVIVSNLVHGLFEDENDAVI